jgi:hypothetical protein
MPNERPTLPLETHAQLLRRGESKGLPLQAYEVAWTGTNERLVNTVRVVAGVLMLIIFVFVSAYR